MFEIIEEHFIESQEDAYWFKQLYEDYSANNIINYYNHENLNFRNIYEKFNFFINNLSEFSVNITINTTINTTNAGYYSFSPREFNNIDITLKSLPTGRTPQITKILTTISNNIYYDAVSSRIYY